MPSIYVYAGTILPGVWKGQMLTIVSPFEAVGAMAAGKMAQEDYEGIEKNACPSRWRVRRNVHGEHDVLFVRGAGHEPHGLVAVVLA